MDNNPLTLLLVGGGISLVSTLAGIALQHWFDLQKKESAEKTRPVWEFYELMESHSVYLPEKVLSAGSRLFSECVFLSNAPTVERTETCMNFLVAFQNTIRQCVGVDRISADLLKAFGVGEREKIVEAEVT